ncbi:hypothetical protein N7447_008602 [Penicillium robsamsonii]|uniref:uncharacterized protein n=1 Tax=Penicillium robsamsonii TaxID=1792511 RepID=UPI002547E012|nr:uncharacterized protein N7447_008602 [Penicillium robsamsonii]KAJ5816369.1 hypothetical protein N7447_008602 [Penicillium robsamsonii]
MDPPFNNGQYPGGPGSFTSSWTDYDGRPYYSEVQSSADVTSLNSDLPQQEFTWINPELGRQAPELPEKFDSDLAGIDPKYHEPDDDIPQTLEGDLGSSTVTERAVDDAASESTALQPSQAVQTLPGGNGRPAMGIPSCAPFALQPSIDGAFFQVLDAYRAVGSSQSSPGQVSQALLNIEAMRTFFLTQIPASPISSTESSEQGREAFRCWVCSPRNQKTFAHFATLKRHLAGHDILEHGWRCPDGDCSRIIARRDRMQDHLRHRHKRFNVSSAEVEETRVTYAPPTNCPLCPQETPTWRAYFDHIKEHCLVSPGLSAPTNGDPSRRGGDGGGDGGNGNGHAPGHCQGYSLTGPSNMSGEPSNQSNNWIGGTYSNTNFGDFRRNNVQPAFRPNNVTGEQLMGDMPPPPFRSRTHLPRVDGQPRAQPPQNPGLPRSNPSTKRKRSDKQKQPAEEKAPDPNKCRRCKHFMATCQLCKSVRGCHECGGMSRSAIQVRTSSTTPAPTLPDVSPTIYNLNPSYLPPSGNYETPQNMLTQPSNYYYYNGVGYVDPRAIGGTTNTYMGNPTPDSRYAMVAMVPENHPILSDLSHKVQKSAVVERDINLLHSIGLGKSLSIKGQAKEIRETTPGAPGAPGHYADLAFRAKRSSAILESPQPVSPCQCPCVRVPAVDYKAHAKLKLSPNERVEMAFQMTPERGTTHPLRTRVRVFVKLFTLRVSAAQSKAKQKAHSITPHATSAEHADSDSDSDQGLTPTSPSGSEITPPFDWTEEVQDWSFSFELNWVILKISQWTSRTNTDTCQKLFVSNPGHILELISIYILCMFKASWVSKGRNGLLGI